MALPAQYRPHVAHKRVVVRSVSRSSIAAAVLAFVFAAMCGLCIATFGVQLTRVDGPSMEPTIDDQDCVFVDRLAYELGTAPSPGDIVTLYYPADPDRVFVKRVIASGGQSVRITDGHVFVDGEPLRDDYVDAARRGHDNWGPQIVSDGYYFVMGDDRSDSSDSREWGFVPRRYVIGKVKFRLWPLRRLATF